MVRRLALALTAAALLMPPSVEGQQYMEWLNQCTPGAIQACASFGLGMQYLAGMSAPGDPGRTVFTFWMSNLQGRAGLPNPGPYSIRNFFVAGITSLPSGIFTEGPLGGVKDPASPTALGAASLGATHFTSSVYGDLRNGAGIFQAGNHAFLLEQIWGCDRPPIPEAVNHTCDGGARIEYSLQGRYSMNQSVTASFDGVTYSGGSPFGCTVGNTCVSFPASVPEPATWLLTTLGLFGLAAMRRREAFREA